MLLKPGVTSSTFWGLSSFSSPLELSWATGSLDGVVVVSAGEEAVAVCTPVVVGGVTGVGGIFGFGGKLPPVISL